MIQRGCLRYIDRKKVTTAAMKINKIVSLIKSETVTETNSALHTAGNNVAKIMGYKNKEMTRNIENIENRKHCRKS